MQFFQALLIINLRGLIPDLRKHYNLGKLFVWIRLIFTNNTGTEYANVRVLANNLTQLFTCFYNFQILFMPVISELKCHFYENVHKS